MRLSCLIFVRWDEFRSELPISMRAQMDGLFPQASVRVVGRSMAELLVEEAPESSLKRE